MIGALNHWRRGHRSLTTFYALIVYNARAGPVDSRTINSGVSEISAGAFPLLLEIRLSDPATWSGVLTHLPQHSLVHAGSSRIFIDTFFRYVSDREILFIKRNERRFWTRTAAREDAESALTHVMNLEESAPGEGR